MVEQTQLANTPRPPFGLLLSQSATLLNVISDEACAPLGLRARQVTFLNRIASAAPHAVAIVTLGIELHIDDLTLNAFVDELTGLGFVASQPTSAADAIALTASGRDVLAEAKRRLADIQASFLAPLENGEADALFAYLAKLLDGHRAIADARLRGRSSAPAQLTSGTSS